MHAPLPFQPLEGLLIGGAGGEASHRGDVGVLGHFHRHGRVFVAEDAQPDVAAGWVR